MHTNYPIQLFPIGSLTISDGICSIKIKAKFTKGLLYLSKFSHLLIFAELKNNAAHQLIQFNGRLTKLDSKAGEIVCEASLNREGTYALYDLKPFFPCEDNVLKSSFSADKADKTSYITSLSTVAQTSISPSVPTSMQKHIAEVSPLGNIVNRAGRWYLKLMPDSFARLNLSQSTSHLKIYWWFNQFDKAPFRLATLCQPPYENAPKTGVFASRSPVRPNPIARTIGRIISISNETCEIEISPLDCFNNTPIIGIAPYNETEDQITDAKLPEWLAHWPSFIEEKEVPDTMPQLLEDPLSSPALLNILGTQQRISSAAKYSNAFQQKESEESLTPNTDFITLKGVDEHNLKHISVSIPKGKITVLTGVSGSGKSTLAFDVLYKESTRRFMSHLNHSDTALSKPRCEEITGLPPAIAISQDNVNRNPRSTVGSITGLHHNLALLFSKLGTRHCPHCGHALSPLTVDEIIDFLTKLPAQTPLTLTPYNHSEPVLENYLVPALNSPDYETYKMHLKTLVPKALKTGSKAIWVQLGTLEPFIMQTSQMCYYCNHLLFELTPTTFNANYPESMCPVCKGMGVLIKPDLQKILSHPERSILDNASKYWGDLRKFKAHPNANWMKGEVLALADALNVDLEQPWDKLPDDFKNQALYGSQGNTVSFHYEMSSGRTGIITRPVEGAIPALSRLYAESKSTSNQLTEDFMTESICPCCNGESLNIEGRSVILGNLRFPEVLSLSLTELKSWLLNLPSTLTSFKKAIAESFASSVSSKLEDYIQIGLGYLTLNRKAPTLSGGELRRLHLTAQLNSDLSGILYILDEPSTGLHPKDYAPLIKILKKLKDLGNTLLIVEHHAEIIKAADYIIDIGPGAGSLGGQITAVGIPADFIKNPVSETAQYISGIKQIRKTVISNNTVEKTWLTLKGAKTHNLKNVNITFPLNSLTCITGVSGSGKSSLTKEVLIPAVRHQLSDLPPDARLYTSLEGAEVLDQLIYVTQTPIARTSRSSIATYSGIMDEIRKIFAALPDAKSQGFKMNHFSFNSKDGACSYCHGEGALTLNKNFMEDFKITCPICKGKHFNEEVLKIEMHHKTIYDVLEMTVNEALTFFKDYPRILCKLQLLSDVGLDYLKLIQSTSTLSGGEAERLKLTRELALQKGRHILYILDEPTAGLHFSDIKKLFLLIEKLLSEGHSVVIIEHNTDLIRQADWIIDLGPEGGINGGEVIAMGTPSDIAKLPFSATGCSLNKLS